MITQLANGGAEIQTQQIWLLSPSSQSWVRRQNSAWVEEGIQSKPREEYTPRNERTWFVGQQQGIQWVGSGVVVEKDIERVGRNQFTKGLICWILPDRKWGVVEIKGFKDNKMIRIVFLNNPSGSDTEDKLE